MREASAEVREVARRLVCAGAAGKTSDPPASAEALRLGCEALRQRLTPLVGREGFLALLTRSWGLAKAEHSWLGPLEVGSDGRTPPFEVIAGSLDPAEAEAACAAVLASFLSLLTSFIGTELTRQMVSGAWPDVPLRDLDFVTQEDDV